MVKLHRLKIAQIQLVGDKFVPFDIYSLPPWEYIQANVVPPLPETSKFVFSGTHTINPTHRTVNRDGTTAIYKMRVANNVLGGLRKDVKKNEKIFVVAEENMPDKRDQQKQETTTHIQEVGKANEAREALAAPIEGIIIELEKDVVKEKLVLPVVGLVLPVEEEGLWFPVEGLADEEKGLAGEEDPNLNLDNLHLLADTAIAGESIKSSISDMCLGVKNALGILQVAVELGCPEIITTCVDYLEASPREEAEEEDILKIIPGLGSLADAILALLQHVNPNTIVVKIILSAIFYFVYFACQTMNQNFYNFNSSGFDQTQPSQFPVIHPPPQETNIEISHDQENVINSVQTFLRKFNRYSFFETPKVLLLAWDRVFEIKDAFGNKQYKPEDIQELFRKLLNDLKNIHEELAEYINTPGWNRPTFYNNDDDDVDYTTALTPVLSTEEPDNSLSMGDEHLDTIPATKSDEVIKSSVEDLIPIPSESEGIPDTMCDVHLVNNPTPLEAKDHFEIVINSNDDYSYSDDDSLYNENIEHVEAAPHDSELVSLEIEALKDNPTPSFEFLTKSSSTSPKSFLKKTNTFDNSLPELENSCFDLEEISSGSTTTHFDISLSNYEAFYFHDDHIEEISSGSTTTHSDISLSEYDSFIFDLLNDQFPPTDRSDFTYEEFADELAHIISPPEYDCFYFRNLPDPGKWTPILNFGIRENLSSTTRVNLPVKDDHSPLLAYVYSRKLDDSCERIFSSKSSFPHLQLGIHLLYLVGSQPMLKSSYNAEDGVIISIPPLVGGVADVVVEIKGTEKRKPKGHFYLEANHVVGHMNALKLHFRNNLEFDTRYFVNEFLSVKGDGTTAIYKIRVDNNVLGGLRKDVKKNQKIIVVAEENMADKKDQHKQGTSAYIQVVGKANEAREALAAAIEGIVIELRVIRERNLAEFERLYSQSVIIQPMESVIGLGGVGLGRLVLLEKDVAVEEKLVLPVDGLVLLVEEEVLGLPIEGLASKEDGLAGEEDPGLNLDNLHLLADTAIVVEEERLSLSS
nr:hypothetical protein [Tanacetum cinerariifolium]